MTRGTVLLIAATAVGLVVRPAGQAPAGEELAPRFEAIEATIEPLARFVPGGNTVLRVRFDPNRPLPPQQVRYDTEFGTVVLADDGRGFDARAGDGQYTALGSMDLVAFRNRLVRLMRSRTAMPVRAWRTRSKEAVDARLDFRHLQAGREYPIELWGDPAAIDARRSLLIRDLSVVQDPTRTRGSCGQASMGPWSFGYLMEQIANTPATGITGAQLARDWLETWSRPQVVNGWTVRARPLVQTEILDDWIAASGGPGLPLDLSRAPFRLLAIVNRIDLRSQSAYGGTGGGELRFVFMHMPTDCQPGRQFLVNFEFRVPFSGCLNLKAYARQWRLLSVLPIGTPVYNAVLQAITQQVVAAGAGVGMVNGSTLDQVRTNENRLDDTGDGLDWELREFRLDPASRGLAMVPLSQTPDRTLNFSETVGDYVNLYASDIVAGDYLVPLQFPGGLPFRAGNRVYQLSSRHWDASPLRPIVNREARHQFSLNTCNACHGRETATEFRHVGGAPFGTPAPLSAFLTGETVADPADTTPVRVFNDLERRATDLDAFLNMSCLASPIDFPLRETH
jgi:hypothetical protein